MANLYFPQLQSGALAQYPIKKAKLVRTIKNILPDGSMVLSPDANATRMVWELTYTELNVTDIQALQALFGASSGPYQPFTFIDPTENMLVWSSNVQTAPWLASAPLQFESGVGDPQGASGAFTLTSPEQQAISLTQTLATPSGFHYCFSVYLRSVVSSSITLIREGANSGANTTYPIGPLWTRLVSSGQLSDQGSSITVGICLAAGQQVEIFGPQLEAQVLPSRYRPTNQVGGVFPNAHWAIEQLDLVAEAPGLSAVTFSVETSIKD